MNTLTVCKYMKQIVGVDHIGVYAADRLPTHLTPSTALVVNTEPHTDSGEHWVAIYLDKSTNVIEYFDSYGQPPFNYFTQFLRHNCHYKYTYNKRKLQGYETSVCGHYCLTYLKCRADLNMSINEYLQLFDFSNAAVNDALVQYIFASIFT